MDIDEQEDLSGFGAVVGSAEQGASSIQRRPGATSQGAGGASKAWASSREQG